MPDLKYEKWKARSARKDRRQTARQGRMAQGRTARQERKLIRTKAGRGNEALKMIGQGIIKHADTVGKHGKNYGEMAEGIGRGVESAGKGVAYAKYGHK